LEPQKFSRRKDRFVPFCSRFGVVDLTALYQGIPIRSRSRQVLTVLIASSYSTSVSQWHRHDRYRLPAFMYSAINGVFDPEAVPGGCEAEPVGGHLVFLSNSDVMCSVLDPEAVPGGDGAEPGGGHLVFLSNSDVMCSVLHPEAVPGGCEAKSGGGHLVFLSNSDVMCSVLHPKAVPGGCEAKPGGGHLVFLSNSDVMCSVLDPEAVPGGGGAEPGGGHLVFLSNSDVMCSVLHPEAVPGGCEAKPGGGHVPGELLLSEGGATQQAGDRDTGVTRQPSPICSIVHICGRVVGPDPHGSALI
jgi:hypothetical protein